MLGPYYVTTDARRHAAWGDPCQAKATAGRVTIDGRTFVLSIDAVAAFEVWERIRHRHGYRLTGTDTGFYNCRHMQHNPDLPMSYHSWGMALDVNWLENPAGSKLVTDIPQAMIDDLLAVRTGSGARVFRWGGDWDWDGVSTDHSYIDAMHWEVVAHPSDLATGIYDPKEQDMTPKQEKFLNDMIASADAVATNGHFVKPTVELVRSHSATVSKLKKQIAAAGTGGAAVGATIAEIVARLT